jgi:hypothetical protein
MGEKGNLVDMTEEVFANLAEQGPQFWIAYKQYEESRSRITPAQAVLGHGEGAQDAPARAQDQATQSPRPAAAE